MSLPEAWVDRIFTKLLLVYGHQFLSRWDGLNLADVKADWGHELAAFQQHHATIAYALENLPPKPPTVLEFREICRRGSFRTGQQAQIAHGITPADPERVRRDVAELRGKVRKVDPRQWARDLQAQHQAGANLTPLQVAFYREALRAPMSEDA